MTPRLVILVLSSASLATAAGTACGSAGGTTSSATASIAPREGGGAGARRPPGFDVNGDRFADVVLGAGPIFLGGLAGLSAESTASVAFPDGSDGRLFEGLAFAGDVNGDGFDDLLHGDPACPNFARGRPSCDVGHAYLHLGGPRGPAATPATTLTAPGGANTDFGLALVGIGDVTGDGFDDVVLGENTGAAWLYEGRAEGLSPSPARLPDPGADDGDPENGTGFIAVAPAGDVDGDGSDDLVALTNHVRRRDGEQWIESKVLLFRGGPGGPVAVPASSILPPLAGPLGAGFNTLGAGDFDGDGHADLAVGMSEGPGGTGEMGPGCVVVYRGTSAGFESTPATTLLGRDPPRGGFGFPLAAVGDLDGDGFDDLVAAASCALPDGGAGSSCEAGRAYVFLGSARGLATEPIAALSPPRTNPSIGGNELVAAGDVDADGFSDFVYGAYLYRGAPGGLATLSPPSL